MIKHPPYHLRPNKAVDRYLLVEILDRLEVLFDWSEYTYLGFGGPYLEDCRLIHEHHPEINLCSIEIDSDTHLRQNFHKFTSKLTCRHYELGYGSFLSTDFVEGTKAVAWLDYTDFTYKNFEEFISTIQKVGENSFVRITLKARLDKALIHMEEGEKNQFVDEFRTRYNDVLPPDFTAAMMATQADYRNLVCRMIGMAAGRAELEEDFVFRPISLSHYSDGTEMVSATGVLCRNNQVDAISQRLQGWNFFKSEFGDPHKIDVPFLTLKERLHLEKYLPYLPANTNVGQQLKDALAYNIDDTLTESISKFQQYADFYRHYPSFVKALL